MMACTGLASIDQVASWSVSGGIVGKLPFGRRLTHSGSGDTTTFVGAICER